MNLKFSQLSPRAKQLSVIALAVAALVGVLYVSLTNTDEGVQVRRNAKTDKTVNVLTDRDNKNVGLDTMAGQIRYLDRMNRQMQEKIARLERDRNAERTDSSQERLWQEKFEAMQTELDLLRAQVKDGGSGSSAFADRPTKRDARSIDDPFQVRARTRAQMASNSSVDTSINVKTANTSGYAPVAGSVQNGRNGRSMIKIGIVSEKKADDNKAKPSSVAKKNEPIKAAYIPAGSILTGTIITGADFPTGKGAFENPSPVLIRLSKQAILPNRFHSDVRDCFMLAGGRGELSSERAKLRTETLSCVRNDGGIIQASIEGFVTGEDGKDGVKGRLVSKQGQLLARTMVAGFLSGLSEAFDYNQVPVLSTTAASTVQYQQNFSAEAAKGGFAKGLKNSMDKVADFYMALANEMVPVIEVNAGRQVDIVVINGATLKVTAQPDLTEQNAPHSERAKEAQR